MGSTPARAASGETPRTEDAFEPDPPCSLGDREDAADRTQPAVERKLADDRVSSKRGGLDLTRGGEDGKRDREVEARSLLAEPGGARLDHDAPLRKLELGRGDPLRTRSFASWHARSARPTIVSEGCPSARWASTSTRRGSRPTRAWVVARPSTPSNVEGELVRLCAGSGLEGALDPLEPSRVHADDVEGRLETGMSRVSGEPERRRAAQSPLLLLSTASTGYPKSTGSAS